jgi:hypothetical protein
MKAKLIKRDNDYCLYNESEETIAASWANVTGKKLSQSNCDEIFGVVDVEKLAYDSSQEYLIKPIESPIFTFGYEQGFNKAMELNKDKLFTLEDMQKAFELGHNGAADTYMLEKNEQEFEKLIQQPTEIEVEIEMEDIIQLKKRAGGLTNMGKPKLDSNGNLILRKL